MRQGVYHWKIGFFENMGSNRVFCQSGSFEPKFEPCLSCVLAMRLRHRQNTHVDCVSSPSPVRYGRAHVARAGLHRVTKRDSSIVRFLLSPKLAENVPKMCRKCHERIKLVKTFGKLVLFAQNAWRCIQSYIVLADFWLLCPKQVKNGWKIRILVLINNWRKQKISNFPVMFLRYPSNFSDRTHWGGSGNHWFHEVRPPP